MIRRMFVVGVAGFALAVAASASAQDAAKIEKGKKVFATASPRCTVCHSIGGVGNAKGSLDGVGNTLSADEIKAWHRTPKEMAAKAKAERKPGMPAYPKEKLSDEDLDALAAYLLSLKKK